MTVVWLRVDVPSLGTTRTAQLKVGIDPEALFRKLTMWFEEVKRWDSRGTVVYDQLNELAFKEMLQQYKAMEEVAPSRSSSKSSTSAKERWRKVHSFVEKMRATRASTEAGQVGSMPACQTTTVTIDDTENVQSADDVDSVRKSSKTSSAGSLVEETWANNVQPGRRAAQSKREKMLLHSLTSNIAGLYAAANSRPPSHASCDVREKRAGSKTSIVPQEASSEDEEIRLKRDIDESRQKQLELNGISNADVVLAADPYPVAPRLQSRCMQTVSGRRFTPLRDNTNQSLASGESEASSGFFKTPRNRSEEGQLSAGNSTSSQRRRGLDKPRY